MLRHGEIAVFACRVATVGSCYLKKFQTEGASDSQIVALLMEQRQEMASDITSLKSCGGSSGDKATSCDFMWKAMEVMLLYNKR